MYLVATYNMFLLIDSVQRNVSCSTTCNAFNIVTATEECSYYNVFGIDFHHLNLISMQLSEHLDDCL